MGPDGCSASTSSGTATPSSSWKTRLTTASASAAAASSCASLLRPAASAALSSCALGVGSVILRRRMCQEPHVSGSITSRHHVAVHRMSGFVEGLGKH